MIKNMDNWESIKEVLKLTGGKYILAEKGEPSYVIVELSEYVDLLKRNNREENNFENNKRNNKEDGSPISISQSISDLSEKGNNIQGRNDLELENLSERGLIEKINSDINVWKDLQDRRVLKKMEIRDPIKQEYDDSRNGNLDTDLEALNTEDKIVIEKI